LINDLVTAAKFANSFVMT